MARGTPKLQGARPQRKSAEIKKSDGTTWKAARQSRSTELFAVLPTSLHILIDASERHMDGHRVWREENYEKMQ
jgi:hypothetical protein